MGDKIAELEAIMGDKWKELTAEFDAKWQLEKAKLEAKFKEKYCTNHKNLEDRNKRQIMAATRLQVLYYRKNSRRPSKNFMKKFMKKFYIYQIVAAEQICEIFSKGEISAGILVARTMSGKTGTFTYTSNLMLKRNIVDKVMIICGASDKNLQNQLNSDLAKNCLQEYIGDIKIYFQHDIKEKFENDYLEHKRQDKKILIINEESHYASDKTNIIHKVLDRIGVEDAPQGVKYPGLLYLSVSATPYAELECKKQQNQKKFEVNLQVGPNYRWAKNFLDENRIKVAPKFKDIVNNLNNALINLIPNKKVKKYGIIRLVGKKVDDMKDLCKRMGITCVVYDAKGWSDGYTNKSWNRLREVPKEFTCIIIKGKARMGDVLYKNNIAWGLEYGDNRGLDVIMQGLLGRLSGYISEKNGTFEGIIYLTKTAIKSVRLYINEGFVPKSKGLKSDPYTRPKLKEDRQMDQGSHKWGNKKYVGNRVLKLLDLVLNIKEFEDMYKKMIEDLNKKEFKDEELGKKMDLLLKDIYLKNPELIENYFNDLDVVADLMEKINKPDNRSYRDSHLDTNSLIGDLKKGSLEKCNPEYVSFETKGFIKGDSRKKQWDHIVIFYPRRSKVLKEEDIYMYFQTDIERIKDNTIIMNNSKVSEPKIDNNCRYKANT